MKVVLYLLLTRPEYLPLPEPDVEWRTSEFHGPIIPRPSDDDDINGPGECCGIDILVILVWGTDRIDRTP
jgi:hypothetical protein